MPGTNSPIYMYIHDVNKGSSPNFQITSQLPLNKYSEKNKPKQDMNILKWKKQILLKRLALQMQISISCLKAIEKSYELALSLLSSPRSRSFALK